MARQEPKLIPVFTAFPAVLSKSRIAVLLSSGVAIRRPAPLIVSHYTILPEKMRPLFGEIFFSADDLWINLHIPSDYGTNRGICTLLFGIYGTTIPSKIYWARRLHMNQYIQYSHSGAAKARRARHSEEAAQ